MQPDGDAHSDTIITPFSKASNTTESTEVESPQRFSADGRGKAWLILLIMLGTVFVIARLIGFI